MKISEEEVKHIASLARLKFTDEEVPDREALKKVMKEFLAVSSER